MVSRCSNECDVEEKSKTNVMFPKLIFKGFVADARRLLVIGPIRPVETVGSTVAEFPVRGEGFLVVSSRLSVVN